jgi:HEAT repeat protein
VRYTAVDTYAKLAPSEARAVLEAAAKDEDERVRERAADLLKKTPAPR